MTKAFIPHDPILSPVDLGGHLVPGIWRYYLPKEVFSWQHPAERLATCLDCPKVVTEDFRADYRCCTYHPRVTNYALGMALRDKTAAPLVKDMIKTGRIIPEGTCHTPQEWIDYLDDNKQEVFGKSEKVLCNFLNTENGFCMIYAFRNSVCSTFFCQHDHGGRGDQYWEKTQILVGQLEAALSQWALEQLGFDFKAYIKRYNKLAKNLKAVEKKGGGWSDAARKTLFAEWYGKEEELFLKCGEIIAAARDSLWAHASSVDILEPNTFEKAQIRAVPKRLKDEIDPEDFDDGESAPIDELWDDLKKSYKKLFKVPDRPLRLSKRVVFHENKTKDSIAQHFKKFPYRLDYLVRKNGKAIDWFNHISAEDQAGLAVFKKARKNSPKTLAKLKEAGVKDPGAFVQEWFGKRVLIVEPK